MCMLYDASCELLMVYRLTCLKLSFLFFLRMDSAEKISCSSRGIQFKHAFDLFLG
jgi:hypothetical protein